MKKHERYLAALNSFPIERTLGSMITTKQMLRYFLTTCAGMVTLVAVQPDGKGRMVSMGSNRSEFYSTTVVGESLAKIVAASDHVVACYSPTSAVIVLRNMVASRVFHDIAMSVARTAKQHEKEGDASFYDDVSRIRSEFVDEFVTSVTRLNEYISILNMMHRHMDQVDNAHFKRYALSVFGEQSGYARKAFDEIGVDAGGKDFSVSIATTH